MMMAGAGALTGRSLMSLGAGRAKCRPCPTIVAIVRVGSLTSFDSGGNLSLPAGVDENSGGRPKGTDGSS
jgi:hypothetical protein